eukprot:TRINITY_DN6668_c0_g1_i2.p1 TRINITY_DN6668_c0_g1~~TRINITY_DN6668_c0_g1_i2.p1  ORF type:complete len:523 (+),score=56.01 TRINITY_DN6668_c0_g1_i2:32-1570(+)
MSVATSGALEQQRSALATALQDAGDTPDHRQTGSDASLAQDELTFSYRNEVAYFIGKGMPMCFAAVMNFGIPPLLEMCIAGHIGHEQSAYLQASLGYARLWYNVTSQMPLNSLLAYFSNVIPGCIGAGREDRIPSYLQRSILLTLSVMIPFYVLQFVAGTILHALGVDSRNADDVSVYCRLMVISAIVNIFNSHFEVALNNMGWVKYTMWTSLVTGLGINGLCTSVFILKFGWGIYGAALARIVVQLSRLCAYLLLMKKAGLIYIFRTSNVAREQILTRRESWEFTGMAIPSLLSSLAGWLIFELQILAITNIRGISEASLAAGALWVQFEGAMAAAQGGWINSASMRSLNLLGRKDPGACKAFWLFHNMSAVVVAAMNVLLLSLQSALCSVVSDDLSVHRWFGQIFWLLTLHMQTRISCLVTTVFFIPLGKGMLRTLITFVSFYVIAAPIALTIALTDLITNSVGIKLGACVGCTSMAQLVQFLFNAVYLCRLDWHQAGMIINQRANADRR